MHEHCARAFSVNRSYILTISSPKLSKKEFRPPIQQTHWPGKILRLTHNPILLNISFTDDTMPCKGYSMACTLSSLEETMWIESIVFCAAKKITSSTFWILHSLLAMCSTTILPLQHQPRCPGWWCKKKNSGCQIESAAYSIVCSHDGLNNPHFWSREQTLRANLLMYLLLRASLPVLSMSLWIINLNV